MFCPTCRSEFVEGVTRCVEDDIDLVEELPPIQRHRPHVGSHRLRSRPDLDDPVLVHEFTGEPRLGEPRAEFIRTALEENGIRVEITGEFGLPGPYARVFPAAPVQVFVDRADAERAREIIAEVEGSSPLEPEGAPGVSGEAEEVED